MKKSTLLWLGFLPLIWLFMPGKSNFPEGVMEANCSSCSSVSELDSLALVDIYHSTDGGSWDSIWTLSTPVCNWYGVKLNDDCRVSHLFLQENSLRDTIPISIGNLTELVRLRLYDNELTGTIPDTLGSLNSLKELLLHQNDLTGSIPPKLGNLSKLTRLWLNSNKLEGTIPCKLGQLEYLKVLRLDTNALCGSLPHELAAMRNLNRIDLSGNQLWGCFPESYDTFCNVNIEYAHFENNAGLPWQGNFQMWCDAPGEQIGAICNDNNPITENDIINENCSCVGEVPPCLNVSKAGLSSILALEGNLESNKILGVFDLDGDGYSDVLMRDNSDTLGIWIYSDGVLNLADKMAVPSGVQLLNLGDGPYAHNQNSYYHDFDNDGTKDLLLSFSATDCLAGQIRIYWGNYCSKYFNENNFLELQESSGCYTGFAVDFDQDGDLDIYTDKRNGGDQNFFYENNGSGIFNQVSASATYTDFVFYFLDFTEDNLIDQIGISRTGSGSGFYLKSGNGTTDFMEIDNAFSGDTLANEFLINWDSDTEEHQEFIFQNLSISPLQKRVEVAKWNGANVEFDTIPLVNDSSDLIEVIDWNLDGWEDIFVSESSGTNTYNLAVYLNDGTSGFEERQCIVEDVPYRFVDVFDFSGTGDFKVRAGNIANDSTFLFDLIPLPQVTDIDTTLCANESISINGNVYDEPGFYSDTLSNFFGCDSIINLTLDWYLSNTIEIDTTTCMGDSIIVGDTTYDEPGFYSDTLSNFFGCDSIINLTLDWYLSNTIEIDTTTCMGDSIIVGDTIYDEPGFYSDTLSNFFGCDSIVNLTLDWYPSNTVEIDTTICMGDFIIVNGITYDVPDAYFDTLSNSFGCDSIVNIILLDWYPSFDTVVIDSMLCIGDFIVVNNTIYDEDNSTGTEVLDSSHGCSDSIVKVDLSFITGIPIAIDSQYTVSFEDTVKGEVLSNDFLDSVTISYDIIEEETSLLNDTTNLEFHDSTFTFTPSVDTCGSIVFEYIICNADCPDLCNTAKVTIDIILAFNEDIPGPNAITPNGDKLNDFLIIPDSIEGPDNKLMIFNEWGNLVYEAKPYDNDWNGVNQNGQPLPQATYYYVYQYRDDSRPPIQGRVTILK